MTRSRLSYPLNRGMDTEAGGAADLQTDVMRFMAIISLCLVAIFALVQSLPMPAAPPEAQSSRVLEKAVAAPEKAAAVAAAPEPAPVPAAEKPGQPRATAAAPRREPLPPAVPYEEPDETNAAARRKSVPAPLPPPSAAAPSAPAVDAAQAVGFTLRFESDLALTRLVARNEIGLYAIRPGKALRMSVNGGEVSFWPASSPGQMHEMDASTVPPEVITALRRSGTPGSVKWGVTLPPRLSRDLDRYLDEHKGGSLVIGANGDLRLER